MFKILTLNNISVAGLRRMPREKYEVASEIQHPDAILLRSFKMHDMEIAPSVAAVGRAGAGVNNIPVAELTDIGVPVFNAPGANANAVKELVIAGILMAARNIPDALAFSASLEGSDEEVSKAVEAGKKQFVGFELPGKTLGVIGLGAIGVQVANAAHDLGMDVIGYDPAMTVDRAWELTSGVIKASGIDQLFRTADIVSVHVPLIDATRNIVNAERIALLPEHAVIVNLARGGIVDEAALLNALDNGRIRCLRRRFSRPVRCSGTPEGHRTTAPGSFNTRGRRELRSQGSRKRSRISREWQYTRFRKFSGGRHAARRMLPSRYC